MVRVETATGWLEGEQRAKHVVFRGVPFAKPPVGKLRFRAPEPIEPWSGVRSATSFGPSSLQAVAQVATSAVPEPRSEDCLYLNVYTMVFDKESRLEHAPYEEERAAWNDLVPRPLQ